MIKSNVNQITELINENLEFIIKIKTEKFKDFWIMDVILNNTILHIEIKDKIYVDINNAMHQYLLDFSKNEKSFNNFEEFRQFFLSIVKGIREQTKDIYAKYKEQAYLCEIEATSVDPDRQMGPETIYTVSFSDEEGDEIIALEISEYPMGAFSILKRNSDVEIDENKVLKYFKYDGYDDE
jgi:hypothetical protein